MLRIGVPQVPTGQVDSLSFFGDLSGVEDGLMSNFVRWIQMKFGRVKTRLMVVELKASLRRKTTLDEGGEEENMGAGKGDIVCVGKTIRCVCVSSRKQSNE